MRDELTYKLSIELGKEIASESQVVYVLSRIRKLLELNPPKDRYQRLKFFCDWTLHTQINNTKSVEDVIKGILGNQEGAGHELAIHFNALHKELKAFLGEYGLPMALYASDKSLQDFNKLLSEIYADTPLMIGKEYKLTWTRPSIEDGTDGAFKKDVITAGF
ncbi:MAG: hypothetical protein JST90_07265 [Bacteroidetes bacterium]|nr:hypothetical protein [Bacteroidota bacterium]